MNLWHKHAATLALLACFLVSSCLDVREEIWIHADASGAARITVSAPAVAASIHGGEDGVKKLIADFMAETPEFTSHVIKTRTEQGRLHIDVSATFSNAMDLAGVASGPTIEKLPATGVELMGKAEVNLRGLDIDFKRIAEFSKVLPGAGFIPKSQLDGRSVTTIIHLPNAATSHNATNTKNKGRTLVWKTALAIALSKPTVNAFTMPLPIPWLLIGFVTLLLAILIAVLCRYLIRRRRARIV